MLATVAAEIQGSGGWLLEGVQGRFSLCSAEGLKRKKGAESESMMCLSSNDSVKKAEGSA